MIGRAEAKRLPDAHIIYRACEKTHGCGCVDWVVDDGWRRLEMRVTTRGADRCGRRSGRWSPESEIGMGTGTGEFVVVSTRARSLLKRTRTSGHFASSAADPGGLRDDHVDRNGRPVVGAACAESVVHDRAVAGARGALGRRRGASGNGIPTRSVGTSVAFASM